MWITLLITLLGLYLIIYYICGRMEYLSNALMNSISNLAIAGIKGISTKVNFGYYGLVDVKGAISNGSPFFIPTVCKSNNNN